MAKAKGEVKEEAVDIQPGMTIGKYLQYHGEATHPYTRAFCEVQYRDIIKTIEEWNNEVAKLTEGNK